MGQDPLEVLKRIRALLPEGAQLHAQVIAEEAEAMAEEAEHLWQTLGDRELYVKIPVSADGLKSMTLLKRRGRKNITATDIHTMFCVHGFMADVLGASFKNTRQIQELCLPGVGAVTAAPGKTMRDFS